MFDLDRTAAVIRAHNPDIVALQEVGRHWSADTEWRDQAVELERRLGMAMVYGANLDRDPPEAGAPRRQYGTAILSAWPVLASRNILLPRAARTTSSAACSCSTSISTANRFGCSTRTSA